MTYEVGRHRTINASLAVKLAPEIARGFGKQSVDTVVAHGGMLAQAEISSEEAGTAVAASNRERVAYSSERQEIARQLAAPGLKSAERVQLQDRLQRLRDGEFATGQSTDEALLKLASTPMTLRYLSGGVDPGLSDGPILGAMKDGWTNIISGGAFLLMLAITLVPWAAAALLLTWAYRWGARRFRMRFPRDAA
jgi:hypothetical protein